MFILQLEILIKNHVIVVVFFLYYFLPFNLWLSWRISLNTTIAIILFCFTRNRSRLGRNGSCFYFLGSCVIFWQRSSCNWKCKKYRIDAPKLFLMSKSISNSFYYHILNSYFSFVDWRFSLEWKRLSSSFSKGTRLKAQVASSLEFSLYFLVGPSSACCWSSMDLFSCLGMYLPLFALLYTIMYRCVIIHYSNGYILGDFYLLQSTLFEDYRVLVSF